MSLSSTAIANLEAEQAVLGAVLICPQLFPQVAALLTPASFYGEKHALIFQAMQDIHGQGRPLDLVLLTSWLQEQGLLGKAGGAVFLMGLSDNVGSSAYAEEYARLVQDKYRVRQLQARAQEIAACCAGFDGQGDVRDLYLYADSQIQDCIQGVDASGLEIVSLRELLAMDFSQMTPVLGGGLLPEGCTLMIAGESGEGKSLLGLEMALHLALGRDLWGLEIPRARRVLIIQFENTDQLDQVRARRMLKGLQVQPPEGLVFSRPLEPIDLGGKIERARLEAMIHKSGAEVVIYDPLACLHQENENDNARMRRIMLRLRQISRSTNTTAIVVHHYGKPGKEEQDGRYRTRGASSIRDAADTLLGFSYHKSEDDTILRNLDFFKVKNGPALKPLLLERDKETFLHRLSQGDTVCSPARVLTILVEKLGGEAKTKDLWRAIQQAVGCQETLARIFLQKAVQAGLVREEDNPKDKRKKVYTACSII